MVPNKVRSDPLAPTGVPKALLANAYSDLAPMAEIGTGGMVGGTPIVNFELTPPHHQNLKWFTLGGTPIKISNWGDKIIKIANFYRAERGVVELLIHVHVWPFCTEWDKEINSKVKAASLLISSFIPFASNLDGQRDFYDEAFAPSSLPP